MFIRSKDSSLCEADRKLLQYPEIAAFFQEDVKEAFTQGVRGLADEAILLYTDWGFELGEINVPVYIIHGEDEKFAPLTFAIYLDKTLPNSTLKTYSGRDHLFLITAFDEIFDWIAHHN
jgi:pimeloyl-ACP methyl ester carboxylesterase